MKHTHEAHGSTHKKNNKFKVAAAGIISAAALAICGIVAFTGTTHSDDIVTDDYAVEHVQDRILNKISNTSQGEDTRDLTDTGYRVRTRTLVTDAAKVASDSTIEDVYSGTDDDIVDKLLYQSESLSTVYDCGDADNYVAYLDVAGDNGKLQHPQDAVFAYDTTQGEMIDSARYDRDTGLAYIPKSLFEEERVKNLVEGQQALQAQVLTRYDHSQASNAYEQDKNADEFGSEGGHGDISSANSIPVAIRTESGSASKMSRVPLLGNQFAVTLTSESDAASVQPSDISVTLNDGAIALNAETDAYELGSNKPSLSYDSETGALNVYNVSPSSVLNMEVGVSEPVEPSVSLHAVLATAGEIMDPTDNAYRIGYWGEANCSGWTSSNYDATTKTITTWGAGGSVQQFDDITLSDISDGSCAYVISVGSCPSSLGSSWTANGGTGWRADCIHAYYPNGTANPPSGGYYKVLDADWNNQTITVAFFITCNSCGQEGAIVLNFYAPRNGMVELYKKANANPSLGSAWSPTVEGAKFGVYTSKSAAEARGANGLVKTLTSDASGVARGSFEDGTYYVSEVSAPWPYLMSNQIVSFTARPKSRDKAIVYDDTVPPIQIKKSITPSADSNVEGDIVSDGKTVLRMKASVAHDGKSIMTEITAKEDLSNVVIKNSSSSALNNPASDDPRFDAGSGTFSSLSAGESVTVTQSIKTGQGWSNLSKLAPVCSVSVGSARADLALKLHAMSLAGTTYGVYSDQGCTNKLGDAVLDAHGFGWYGTHENEWLASNTTYYVRELSGVNGYTVSSDVYPITTARNSHRTVNVSDSFSTLIVTKESGAGKSLTDKMPQFSLKGAKYGVFAERYLAEQHDESKVVKTLDGRPAVMTTDKFGNATEVALGAGTFFVAEVPSDITRPWEYGHVNDDFDEPSDIDAAIFAHDFNSKSNGKFILDENVYEMTLTPGGTIAGDSQENIPVRVQLQKQSTRTDLAQMSQFSLEGAVFGIYDSEAAAIAAPTGSYGDAGFTVSYVGAVGILYGNTDGTTTVSEDLPLGDYYIKELRSPRNYKIEDGSSWMVGSRDAGNGVLHVTADDFLSSGKYIDGILTCVPTVKVNEPKDVTVQVKKDANEVPDSMKNEGNAMSLAGASFALYRTFDDARDDKNRLTFKTNDQAADDESKTDLLTSGADGWTNKAVGLPAEECYWIREIEPPHVISDDPEQNAKNIAESMYVLDSEPVRATYVDEQSIVLVAHKDNTVKPVSITIGKYAMAMDSQGRNLHVGEKDSNGIPYNDAYDDDSLEGAIFAVFDSRDKADAARESATTEDVNDVSVREKAFTAGAIAVMSSDATGVCDTVDNLSWKADGYYVLELKAPTSGCYQRNDSVLQVTCDKNTENSEHVHVSIDANKVSKRFDVDEVPNYYYVKIEKVSTDAEVMNDSDNYDLKGIHFGIYRTQVEAAAATAENPGKPLYNLYTEEVTHDDGSVHYEAISGLTGPGTFWAKELIADDDYPNGFQALPSPIRVEAHLGGIPVYDATPIVPENGAPVVDSATGQLGYKTAEDIDKEKGTPVAKMARAASAMGSLNAPTGATMENVSLYATNSILNTNHGGSEVHLTPVYHGGSVLEMVWYDGGSGAGRGVEFCGTINGTDWTLYYLGQSYYNFNTWYNYNRWLDGFIGNNRAAIHIDGWYRNGGSWLDMSDNYFFPQVAIYYNLNGGSWVANAGSYSPQLKNQGYQVSLLSDGAGSIFKRTGYNFAGWTHDYNNAVRNPLQQVTHYLGGQVIGTNDWNQISQVWYGGQRWGYSGAYMSYATTPSGGSNINLYATWTPKQYTVSFNANGGANASTNRTATYDSAMPTATVPTRTGYIFDGYYDAASGGTKYYNANGTSARTWNKTSNATLYAHWTPIKYTVKYVASDPDASLTPGMDGTSLTDSHTYDVTGALRDGIFHKFGYKSHKWSYKDDAGNTHILDSNPEDSNIAADVVRNLTATNNREVVLTAVWNLNEYYVKFNDGLSTKWGPAPEIESGTNPDTGTPWSIGYQQKVYFDDWEKWTDLHAGEVASEALTKNRYSHKRFSFLHWMDASGNKYEDMQEVHNLTMPDKTLELTGIWYPSFDYGVDCEANIIPNSPVGGITVQKVVNSGQPAPEALNDLSGIVFELFLDEECRQSVATSTTDATGLATFSDVETAKTYYVKEKSLPKRLEPVMDMNESAIAVQAGADKAFELENDCRQLSLVITKIQSSSSVWNVEHSYLSLLSPDGAKFAIYASKQDALNDVHRIPFYDENNHVVTVTDVSNIIEENGMKSATTTIHGLPNQGLWLMELAAPDHGKHEYAPSKKPIFISEEVSDLSDDGTTMLVEVPNDVEYSDGDKAHKHIDGNDLSRLPEQLHASAAEAMNGIVYAIYANRADAANRTDNYLQTFTVKDSEFTLSNVPYNDYYLVEYSLPDSAIAAGISRSDKVLPIVVDSNGITPEPSFFDCMNTKKMYLKKVDADTGEPITGVVFDIYVDDSKTELLCSSTPTDAQGVAMSDKELIPGRSYFVQERYESLPAEYSGQGLGSDNTWSGWVKVQLSDTIDDATVVKNSKNDETGALEVVKASNTDSSLAGAIFSVYDVTGTLYATMTTDGNGMAHLDGVPVGHYTVRETNALPLHALTSDGSDAVTFECAVQPNTCCKVNDGMPVTNYQGYVKVHKESDAPELTAANPDIYSLAGAVYSLYPIDEDGNASVTPLSVTMTTDENGDSEPVAVPLGFYEVIETTEPGNFSTDEEQRRFRIDVTTANDTKDNAVVVESKDSPVAEPLANLEVEKRSAETHALFDGSPQGVTSMGNTKFVIEHAGEMVNGYDDALTVEKTRHWVIATDQDGRATFSEDNIIKEESDALYRDAEGNAVLPAGTIVVREIVPPTGYTLGKAPTTAYRLNGMNGIFEELFSDSDEVKEWDGNPKFTAANDIYRADISFHKSDAFDANKVMSNIPFVLSLLDENGEAMERHIVFTDKDGNFSSRTGSIAPANENDKWLPGDVVNGHVAGDVTPVDSRVWFSGAPVEVPTSADKGALIYGDYELREYSKDDTRHYQSLEPIYFSVRGDNDESWVEVNGQRLDNNDLTSNLGNIENHAIHITGTELLDNATGTHSVGYGSMTATETISYADATPGEKYIFKAYAYDVDTGEPIMRSFVDIDDYVRETQAGGVYSLTAEQALGTVQMAVSFEGYDIAKKKVGIKTEVYHNGYLADTHNADLKDDNESVSSAEIRTNALDSDTGQHVGFADGHVDVTDTVTYENLVPGVEYVMSGVLMDKTDGTQLKDAHGHLVEFATTFTPTERNGSVEVKFSFDAAVNTPMTAVAFETLSVNGKLVAEHKDIDDAAQTVSYPSSVTTARDSKTGTFQGNPENGRVSVIDKVDYSNLVPNRSYELRGILYTLDENNVKHPVASGTATKMFTPTARDGFVEMVFDVDSALVAGYQVMVGESIWSEGKIVASHDDASFANQIVSYPSVRTEAFDVSTGAHVGNGEKTSSVTDVVYLRGLKPGETYKVDGTVMMRDVSGIASVTPIVATDTFTATAANEQRRLHFEIPVTFLSNDIVVYERVSSADGAHLLATHEQASDENQSIHYPQIGTVAISPDGGTHVGSNINNKVVDTVAYDNLVPGYSYEVVGMLVYQDNGEFVTAGENDAPIVSSTSFVANAPSGTVEVPFLIEGVDMAGRTVVVFEQLFVVPSEGTMPTTRSLIATHCDIDDAGQSMFYPKIATVARDKDNGTHVGSSVIPSAVVDTVNYVNLVPGLEYEIHGVLMDKDSGEPLMVGEGDDVRSVEAHVTFVPESENGAVEVPFETLEPGDVINKSVVVYEKLLLNKFEMANHEDIDDDAQSVSYPKIETQARDLETGLHEGYIENAGEESADSEGSEEDFVTIIDTVEYSHLLPGREYKITGRLVDKYETAEANDAEDVESDDIEPGITEDNANAKRMSISESEIAFTPETVSGTVEVTFTVKKSDACGKVMVVFEKLLDENEHEVARHEDISDEAQTVSYPKIGTTALDADSNTHAGSIDGISIVDTIAYEGLLEGHEYVAYGTLMDKARGNVVIDDEGSEVVSAVRFVAAEQGRGTANVVFDAPASRENLEGRTFVAFEKVTEAPAPEESDDEGNVSPDNDSDKVPSGKVIATHEDLEDEQQTIHYPKIGTHAENKDGSKMIPFESDAKIIDTVAYENLVPGVEYVIDGVMMNKQANRELVANGVPVTATKVFVPDDVSGEVEVEFVFDGTNTETCTGVAFESLLVGDAIVAEHRDIDDEEQSVYVSGVADDLIDLDTPLALIPMTGDILMKVMLVFVAGIGVTVGTMYVRKRRR